MKNVYCLMHVPFEGPGRLKPYPEGSFPIHTIRLFYNEIVPRVSEVDYLTVMGGPMNMEDENKYPLAG